MSKKNQEKEIKCSFCGKTQEEVYKIVAGPGVCICNDCISLCSEIVSGDIDEIDVEDVIHQSKDVPVPKEIKNVLDQYVIGQDEAKKVLSVAVYNHYKRIKYNNSINEVEIQKSNILLLGPTGCGKTLLAQTLAKYLKVPFAIADATTLTEAGYVGEDVENILLRLIQAADYDIKKAEKGIIYIDEIDKITRKSENPSITRDVSGEGVQQALLKIIEGTVANVPPQGGRKHPEQQFLQIDTSNILFICGGAFEGLEKLINARVGTKTMGFGVTVKSTKDLTLTECFAELQPQDLLKYGLIPEIVGRLPIVTVLNQLDKDALKQILTKPKNSLIKQYKKLLELDNIELDFDDDAIDLIVDKAIEKNIGARGLRSIFEDVMKNVMYELPSMKDIQKCIITKECVANKVMPDLIKKEKPNISAKHLDEKEIKKEA